jgi:hypothetical protein
MARSQDTPPGFVLDAMPFTRRGERSWQRHSQAVGIDERRITGWCCLLATPVPEKRLLALKTYVALPYFLKNTNSP